MVYWEVRIETAIEVTVSFTETRNAAVNIMSIFEGLGDEEKKERPIQFPPVRGSRYS